MHIFKPGIQLSPGLVSTESLTTTSGQNTPGYSLPVKRWYSHVFMYMFTSECGKSSNTNDLRQSAESRAGSLQQTICSSSHLCNPVIPACLVRHTQPPTSHPNGQSQYTLRAQLCAVLFFLSLANHLCLQENHAIPGHQVEGKTTSNLCLQPRWLYTHSP